MTEEILNCSYFLNPYLNEVVFYAITTFMIVLVSYLVLKKYPSKIAYLGLFFIYLGGLQNIWQRIRYNCVVDKYGFFDLFFFNAADVIITAGMLLIFIKILFYGQQNPHSRR
jgi:lipoprotein signal peptidase